MAEITALFRWNDVYASVHCTCTCMPLDILSQLNGWLSVHFGMRVHVRDVNISINKLNKWGHKTNDVDKKVQTLSFISPRH